MNVLPWDNIFRPTLFECVVEIIISYKVFFIYFIIWSSAFDGCLAFEEANVCSRFASLIAQWAAHFDWLFVDVDLAHSFWYFERLSVSLTSTIFASAMKHKTRFKLISTHCIVNILSSQFLHLLTSKLSMATPLLRIRLMQVFSCSPGQTLPICYFGSIKNLIGFVFGQLSI